MKWLILLTIPCYLACLTPRRVGKYLAKNPHLVRHDTIVTIDTLLIAGIDTGATFGLDTSTDAIDSVLERFDKLLPDSTAEAIAAQIRYVYRFKRVIKDTLTKQIDDITVKIWQNGDQIGVKLKQPDLIEIRTIKTPCPELVYTRGKIENFFYWSGVAWWVLALLAAIVGYIYKQLK